ncbi:hypothetical protein [Sphingobium sp. B11D3D]|uniref:hypothetical protein n=1 Tax=Sphingobium sp. B11D3D TaxID=2940576 RepID=UPI002224BF6D|nr:hypothetical protein [Sphingobium sp. B11D3D]MCW2369939.1 hypothetical protein [Sphingobium sp. B11D3D]
MSVLERDGQNHRFSNEQLNRSVMNLCQKEGVNWSVPFQLYLDAAVRIRFALPMAISIDNLLHTHRNDKLMIRMGKLAIATTILEKEAHSYLCPEEPRKREGVDVAVTNTERIAKSWYLPLMRLLVTGRTLEELERIFENVAFVVFNYDRCLEHFLVNAVINYFNVDPRTAIATVNRITILHPYGQVGHFAWQEGARDSVTSSFGNAEGKLIEIADQLLTFTESAEEGVVIQTRALVAGAETLVFMGFGFLPQNMELLTVANPAATKRVFLTTKGIGDDDVEIVINELRHVLQRKPTSERAGRDNRFQAFVERGTCRELMDHHWLRLTRA